LHFNFNFSVASLIAFFAAIYMLSAFSPVLFWKGRAPALCDFNCCPGQKTSTLKKFLNNCWNTSYYFCVCKYCVWVSRNTLPPKDPYWKKYIIKISMSMGKYKWPKREPREAWTTLWAFRPEVSSLWAWYVAKKKVKSNMITWQKVRVVLWSL